MGLGIGQDKLEGNNKMKESIGFKSPGDNGERERERDWFQNDFANGLLLCFWSPRCLFLPRMGQ